ncbi:MAG: HEAT repeat domain-containing protein, partial [Sedimentisphaerales bacterium]
MKHASQKTEDRRRKTEGRRQKFCPRSSVLCPLLSVLCAVCFAPGGQAESEEADDCLALVIDILRSGEQAMQAVAMSMVREMPSAEVTKALVKELPNLSPTAQIQLLSALADRGDRTALGAVVSATKAKEPAVRIAALKALGQLGDASSVTLLAQRAANSRAEEQKAARESLYRLHGLGVDKAILAEICGSNPQVKVELIRSVGQRNIIAGVETLLKTAQEADSKVQRESLKVLKVIADEKYLPAMVELLLKVKSASVRNEAEKTIAAVAGKIEDRNRRAEAVLAVLPEVADAQKRCCLLSVLGKIGDDSALPAIRKALNSGTMEEQASAIRALSGWPNPKPLNELLKAAKTSRNKIHRVLALRGFVRLLGLESDRPAKETIKLYQQAMDLASNVREKRMVLSGLSYVKSLAALEMAA